jgi:hypothetical protein
MPTDFLSEDMQTSQLPSQMGGRDFLMEPEQKKESLGTSAAYAIPRIATDVGKSLYDFAQEIPNYYEKAKMEVPALFGINTQIKKHPGHAAMQALAGSQEAINKLAQMPLNLAQYGANRLNLLPQSVPNAIAKVTPENTQESINQLFGKPKYEGESLLRGAARNIPEIMGGAKLASALKPSGFLATKNSIKNTILNKHDILENKASEAFKKVSEEVNKKGITQVPIEQEMIEGLREYFPKTKVANKLIEDAKSGNYNALRKMQSDLYKSGKKNLGSDFEADRMKGAEMFEKREDINQAISNHLQKTGNIHLNEILNTARNDYKTLQNIYYNPNMNNAIVNMVNKDFRKIPKNLVEVLNEESNPMQALKGFHGGLENALKKYQAKENVLSKLSKYGIPAGIGAATGYGAYKYGSSK